MSNNRLSSVYKRKKDYAYQAVPLNKIFYLAHFAFFLQRDTETKSYGDLLDSISL
jgi:hypothetical protein